MEMSREKLKQIVKEEVELFMKALARKTKAS